MIDSIYANEEALKNVSHRLAVGDMWEEVGKLQFDFMLENGLLPDHTFLDIGCGSFRGGRHFINYLNREKYYGLDISNHLINEGINNELVPSGLDLKLHMNALKVSDQFDIQQFGINFDYALAFSLFTHLSFNNIRVCLENARPHVDKLFATFFLPDSGIVDTYPNRDPFHYTIDDIMYLARCTGWEGYFPAFDHPRNQKMVIFL